MRWPGVWQSWQDAASASPLALACACIVLSYCAACFLWQSRQEIFEGFSRWGPGVASLWQETQASFAWREAERSAAFTCGALS